MANTEYQRLTRSHSRGIFSFAVASRISLWLGADHLLFIDSNGYAETYKRFHFRDVQTLTLQRSGSFSTVNAVLGTFLTLLVPLGLLTPEPELKIVFFSLAGLLVVLTVVNVLRGPTCRCYLRTAVQEEELPPLRRIRKAEKIFARLRPLIAAAQGGELSPEAFAEKMRERDQSGVAPAEASSLAVEP